MALTQVKTSGIADDAVTLAKQAGGTDGNLITYNASGNPDVVATGNSGQVLTSNGSGAAPTFQAAAAGGISDVVSDTSPQLGGDLDTNSFEIKLDDSHNVVFGDGDDLKIRHNGTDNHIEGLNGSTTIGAVEYINLRSTDSNGSNAKWMIRCHNDEEVSLYYNNTKKFETTNTGATVTGTLIADGIDLGDGEKFLGGTDDDLEIYHDGSDALIKNSTGAYDLSTGGTRRVYIASGGHITLQKSSTNIADVGQTLLNNGEAWLTTNNNICFSVNRLSTDGQLIRFHQDGGNEGNISVSGSTVSYNGGHLSRWSQFKGLSKTDKSARPTIYQGTVLSNLDDLCEWEGEINQQLNMTQVSTAVGDKNVAGVFWTWDNDDDEVVNDFYVAMTGDMVIRVAASTTVARGDLLISAGDGTAKPQADDIIRSSTIGKIISTNSTATYADGSKAYPCVLMAC